jgi:hypothetical protein
LPDDLPAPGGTLTSASQTFTWDPGTAATAFRSKVGTTGRESTDIFDSTYTTRTSVAVPNIPTTGGTLYVRLWYYVSGTWYAVDYTYTEP